MRCFFMQGGHIAAVELLENAADDDAAIRQSRAMFVSRIRLGFDGFEVWDRARRVYRYPEPDESDPPAGTDGDHPADGARSQGARR
jgi:hypothetical protein